MNYYSSVDRTASLKRLVPDLFTDKYKSVLYIGAKSERFHYGDQFLKAKISITVLEVFPKHVEYLKTLSFLNEVVQGDVRYFKTNKKFDVVFWWHGPEHILESELTSTLQNLESCCNKVMVLGCPWGENKQGIWDGNVNEIHLSQHDYNIFESLGYQTECLGVKNVPGSNITSVKFI